MKNINMIVEIPKRSGLNKYEIDLHTNELRLDRVLHGSMEYPEEYGFIPRTMDYDGDPLDVLCLNNYPTFPHCIIPVRIIGVMKMIDQGEKDYKIIAVNAVDPRFDNIKEIKDIGQGKLNEISNFFLRYKELEGKFVEIKGYDSKEAAYLIIQECLKLFSDCESLLNSKADKSAIVKFLSSKK